MRIYSLALRSAILLSGVVALSACNTVSDPKIAENSVAQPVKSAQAVANNVTSDGVNTASVNMQATSGDSGSVASATSLVEVSAANAEMSSVLALATTDASDPMLPALVPLPMFRQTATEALLASATPSLATAPYNEPGVVAYDGVTKSGTANHVVEARAEIAANTKPQLHNLIGQYAAAYQVPERLVHRVVQRESRYNPAARNGPYLGLMQISHATARGMGYEGSPQGLLNASTNLRYAVKYLSGAYKVAGGNEAQAVKFYARGYYYDAKRKGLLEETGLLSGPNSTQTVFIDSKQENAVAPVASSAAGNSGVMVAQTDSIITQSISPGSASNGKSSRVQHKPSDLTQN